MDDDGDGYVSFEVPGTVVCNWFPILKRYEL